MVLRERGNNMASEQPLKKKLRRGTNSESTDETDFIHSIAENDVRSDLSALHLTLPPNINEDDDINFEQFRANDKVFRTNLSDSDEQSKDTPTNENETNISLITISENISIQPAPDIVSIGIDNIIVGLKAEEDEVATSDEIQLFQNYLIRQCLCQISNDILQRPFQVYQISDETNGMRLSEWPTCNILQFLSNIQLLFDVYLKQNNNGHICSKIVLVCNSFVHNEHNLIEQILNLVEKRDKYINYMAAKVFSSFLIIAKTDVNYEWLETIVNYLTIDTIDYIKMNFALEIIKRVVEWKNVEIHVLDDESLANNCTTVPYCDAESFDTSGIKGLVIKSLETKWPELVNKIQFLITQNTIEAQTCVMIFLALWENTISVRANLSVIDTKPFYAHLEYFVGMLNSSLSPIIWKQLLSLFNEVLCYGSTLALQDMLPEDTCQLAHLIVRYVKDFRLLDSLPFRQSEGCTVNSFIGAIPSSQPIETNIDKTLLQKMVLLVLKSVAITIKETRSDSSDSSVGSEDYDFSQDMQLIARSIRDVLRKVDIFIKSSLDFHPETPFSKTLIHLFNDQDDYMVESMVCTLDIMTGISYQNALSSDFIAILNPVHSFIEFLKIVSHQMDVLLEYLIDNETCFLLYLLRFLKFVRRNWSKFVSSCHECGASRTNELDNTMTVLIRLKMQIDRLVAQDLFPYNISPILRLLETCENLYEGNEYSSS